MSKSPNDKIFRKKCTTIKEALEFIEEVRSKGYKPEDTVVGGIIIAETAQTRSNRNIIHRIGIGNIDKDGNRTKFPVKKGDEIILSYDKCIELSVSDTKCYIIPLHNILGIIVEDKPKKKKKRTIKKKK